jgi:Flp pilus assembly CpaF family ATPase
MDAKSRQADSGSVKLTSDPPLASELPCVSIRKRFEIQSGIDACINAKLFGTKLLDILVI